MVIVIAAETDRNHEIPILHQLFEAGLECFHLRKPKKNYEEHCAYLNQINPGYHNRIVVHHFHELIDVYNLKGIHFPEQKRRQQLHKLPALKRTGKTISSSFHEIATLAHCPFEFDYHLLSPVFSSISKEGYKGRAFDVNPIPKYIIGMGGVTANNLKTFISLGYHGAGVLGSIWNSSSPVENFKWIHTRFTLLKARRYEMNKTISDKKDSRQFVNANTAF